MKERNTMPLEHLDLDIHPIPADRQYENRDKRVFALMILQNGK